MYLLRANVSVDIHSQMLSLFLVDEGIKIYTDDYDGAYIDDNGYLNIRVVEGYAATLFNDDVIYRTSTFPYNYLLQIQMILEPIMQNMNIYSIGINGKENKVFVELENIMN